LSLSIKILPFSRLPGAATPEERRDKVKKYLEKKKHRVWDKEVCVLFHHPCNKQNHVCAGSI
jgi:hypothetical protein